MFSHAAEHTSRPTLEGSFGMTASTHWLATASAQAVLERGGNAFDAAVAGAFVLHVVEPHLNGPGGDMTGIFTTAEAAAEPKVLMGQGPAPGGATIAHYRSLGLEMVPGAGGLAAAVPGAVDAWLVLLRDHGTWPLDEILAFAIHYAEQGHPIRPLAVKAICGVEELFREHWTTSAELWMPEGAVPEPGQNVRNPVYGAVLRELASAGRHNAGSDYETDPRREQIEAARRHWSTGAVAEKAAGFLSVEHRHSDGGDYAGVITIDDFRTFQAGYEDAQTIDFRGYTIAKTGPWGQGPVLLQALRILEGYSDEQLDPGTEAGAHLILEALKLAMADRDTYYGDDDIDLAILLSQDYAAQRRAQISERASHDFRPGEQPRMKKLLPPLVPSDKAPSGAFGTGEPTAGKLAHPGAARPGDTCHIDVVDRWGNMISATPSGGWLQSSPTIPGLGFALGTRLQMTWLDERSPSGLQPGRRPRTTLTPTLVLQQGNPVLALGTPGGDQQDQWQLSMLLRVLLGGHTLQQAIDAPNLHTASMPGSFWPRTWVPGEAIVEERIGQKVLDGLRRRGHRVTQTDAWSLGRLSAVARDPKTGRLWAAANPRGMQGYAAGR